MRIFMIFHNGKPLKTYSKTWAYKELGVAKAALRNHVKRKNKFLEKPDKKHFEDYTIVEYDLVEKDVHKI